MVRKVKWSLGSTGAMGSNERRLQQVFYWMSLGDWVWGNREKICRQPTWFSGIFFSYIITFILVIHDSFFKIQLE